MVRFAQRGHLSEPVDVERFDENQYMRSPTVFSGICHLVDVRFVLLIRDHMMSFASQCCTVATVAAAMYSSSILYASL